MSSNKSEATSQKQGGFYYEAKYETVGNRLYQCTSKERNANSLFSGNTAYWTYRLRTCEKWRTAGAVY